MMNKQVMNTNTQMSVHLQLKGVVYDAHKNSN